VQQLRQLRLLLEFGVLRPGNDLAAHFVEASGFLGCIHLLDGLEISP
jgi:hypothetical protein